MTIVNKWHYGPSLQNNNIVEMADLNDAIINNFINYT